eukprot:gene1418-12038_t
MKNKNEVPPPYLEPRVTAYHQQSDISLLQCFAIATTSQPSVLNVQQNEKSKTRRSAKKPQKMKVNKKYNSGKWTKEENINFLKGYLKLGRLWTRISEDYVITRDSIQVTSHAQKIIDRLRREFQRTQELNNTEHVETALVISK